MIVSVPKEIMQDEGRVAAIPATVRKMVDAGLTVLVEAGAGAGTHFADAAYREAGAEIVADVGQLWRRADVVLKVKEPLKHPEFGCFEDELLGEGKTLITFLHPANSLATVTRLRDRNITGISMDCIPRSKDGWPMDALSSMSIVAGYRAIIEAASHLPKMFCAATSGGGSVTPAKVLIIGCGMVGMQSLSSAKGLGAEVYAVDIRHEARERAGLAGAEIVGFDIPESAAEDASRQAKALPKDLLAEERKQLAEVLPEMDVVVPSILILGEHAPVLITEAMVKSMKPGSVIVDVAIDQGGNCELTERGKTVVRHGVTLSGIMNLPGQVPVHSAQLYAQNVCNLLLSMAFGDTLDLDSPVAKAATVTRAGKVVHEGTLHAMRQTAVV
jgi:proton-translocating NAD(P)+ transhydrogenase subunit alpha